MKISEVIQKLQEIQKESGDLEVYILNNGRYLSPSEECFEPLNTMLLIEL